MARAWFTSAPTARHSSCERSISSTPRPLTGFNAAFGPFVSPDGQWIGVFDGASAPALKKVAITGGPAVTLGRPDGPTRGASWGADGTIIFATTNATTGLQRIAAAGGEPTVLTRPNRAAGEADHVWPEILPGGQAVLFTITATDWPPRPGAGRGPRPPHRHPDRADSGRQRRALRVERPSPVRRRGDAASCRVRPRPARRRRYVRGGSARRCRRPRLALQTWRWRRMERWSTSRAAWQRRQRAAWCGWTARARRRRCPHRRGPTSIRGSRRTAAASRSPSATGSWTSGCGICRAARSRASRLTRGSTTIPVWAPDGRQLIFSSEREGARNLFSQAADGSGAATRLTRESQHAVPHIRLARWHAARVHGDRDRDRGGGCACSSGWMARVR